MKYDLTHAILSLRPGSRWSLNGESYSGLNWMDEEQSKPTEEECSEEIQRLQDEYDSNEYQRQRATEYPNVTEQLDYIYHNGVDAWKEMIESIKNKYPKGNQ
jgi:phosphoglycolate phosphatase-like HAD superfamily hydrolase